MRHVLEAGTDAAMLVLFDRAALPDDLDSRLRQDGPGLLDRLSDEGRMFSLNTGADGAYLLHAFVDEAIPESLRPYLFDPLTRPSFPVPSGRLSFAGGEYCSTAIETTLSKATGVGGSFALRPGVYRLSLWRAEYPDDHLERLVAQEVPPMARRLHQSISGLVLAAVAGALLLGALTFVSEWSTWHWFLALVEVSLISLLFVVPRLASYRRVAEQWKVIGRQHPSLVAHLEFTDVA